MRDERYAKLADVLVNYSVAVKRGHLVQISGPTIAEPLITEVYRAAIKAGGHVATRAYFPTHAEIFYNTAKKHQLSYLSPLAKYETETIDRFITIWGDENTRSLANVDPEKQKLRSQSTSELFSRFLAREAAGEILWVGTQFPCNASAQDAEMSLAEYEDFVLNACLVNKKDPIAAWRTIHNKQKRICNKLNKARKIRVVAKDTDLRMKVAGRKWINCDGQANMPDGEIFTGPIENSVEGRIAFSFPACYAGREVHGVRLTFKKGKVVKATADKGEEFLHAMLDTDEGARRVGEFAIGTNYNVQKFTKNTLFDEKIGGTIHMALGASLPESGGVNESGIHWDMVNDLRGGGTIYADGRVVHKNGKFRI